MRKLVYGLGLLFFMSSSVNAGEYIIDKEVSFSGKYCSIKAYGDSGSSIDLEIHCNGPSSGICGGYGGANGYFYYSILNGPYGGSKGSSIRGLNNAINWILNRM